VAVGSLADAIGAVADSFGGVLVAGVPLRVYTDSTQVNPPCAFIPPPDLAYQFSKRRAEVTWVAYLVAPQPGRQDSTSGHLAALLDAVAGLYPFTTAELFDLTLPGGGPSTQAYRLTWIQTIAIGADHG
jgi:hypothetical protein